MKNKLLFFSFILLLCSANLVFAQNELVQQASDLASKTQENDPNIVTKLGVLAGLSIMPFVIIFIYPQYSQALKLIPIHFGADIPLDYPLHPIVTQSLLDTHIFDGAVDQL